MRLAGETQRRGAVSLERSLIRGFLLFLPVYLFYYNATSIDTINFLYILMGSY